jgi:hypothetical protein
MLVSWTGWFIVDPILRPSIRSNPTLCAVSDVEFLLLPSGSGISFARLLQFSLRMAGNKNIKKNTKQQ